jgi:hypothetical protein
MLLSLLNYQIYLNLYILNMHPLALLLGPRDFVHHNKTPCFLYNLEPYKLFLNHFDFFF